MEKVYLFFCALPLWSGKNSPTDRLGPRLLLLISISISWGLSLMQKRPTLRPHFLHSLLTKCITGWSSNSGRWLKKSLQIDIWVCGLNRPLHLTVYLLEKLKVLLGCLYTGDLFRPPSSGSGLWGRSVHECCLFSLLWIITVLSSAYRNHHCRLYSLLLWPSLRHWLTFIYKAILGKLPSCLCRLLSPANCGYNSRLLLSIPRIRTELGKTTFSAPLSWNMTQKALHLQEHVSLSCLKQCCNHIFIILSSCANQCLLARSLLNRGFTSW